MKYFILPIALLSFFSCTPKEEPVALDQSTVAEAIAEAPDIVLTNEKYVPECNTALEAMGSGDIGAFTSIMAENVVYVFNYGDSLVGKSAVSEWWQGRFDSDIESVDFTNKVWLSVDAVQPKYAVEPGDYVMAWFMVHATYKTGKSMSQYVHVIYHFNNAGKVDRVTQFMDRVPIMDAMAAG